MIIINVTGGQMLLQSASYTKEMLVTLVFLFALASQVPQFGRALGLGVHPDFKNNRQLFGSSEESVG